MKSRTSIPVRLMSLLVAAVLLCAVPFSAFAATVNDAVQSDTTGVVQVRALYLDNNNNIWTGYTGTAFLINEEYLLTCDHVFDLSQEDLATGLELYGWNEKQIREHSRIEIVVMRDVTINASIVNESSIMDFAILKLSQKLYDRTYLPLRSSAEVQQTESIYSLGFPGGVSYWQDTNTYTSDDVTITSGRVNKLNTVGTVDYIQHGAEITGGNSGGPLVDENGSVIGINVFTTGDAFESDYSYAVAIDQPRQVLDSLGIAYTMAGPDSTEDEEVNSEPTDVSGEDDLASVSEGEVPAETAQVDKTALITALTEARLLDASAYESDDSMTQFNDALSAAQRVADNADATQGEVDSALTALTTAQGTLVPKPETNNMLWIIIAIAVVVVMAIVVIIVLLMSSKKKNKNPIPVKPYPTPYSSGAPAGGGHGGFTPANNTPVNNSPVVFGGASSTETSVLGQGSTETTVLGQGSTETTVLNQNLGSLTRSKSGEKITISGDNFVIGRERTRVNYCISDNTSIGRTHARFSVRGGSVYITDLKSTNGTFVNSVRLNSGQEVALNNGDKIALADEEFVYRVQ